MSLDKVMLELAQQIEEDSEEVKDGELTPGYKLFQSYARQIRSAVKMNESTPRDQATRHCRRCMAPLGDRDLPGPHCVACQGDLEKRLKKVAQSEEDGVRTAVVLDGPMAEEGQSTSVTIPVDAVVGGPDINVGGHRYRLTVHGLRYVKPTSASTEILLGKG